LQSQAQALEKNWGEQGTLRVLAHTAVGGLTGGVSGAAGAAAAASAAPLLADLQENIQTALSKAGASPTVAKGAGQLISGLTASGIGAAVGGAAGAATGLNSEFNNRQLHPSEVQHIKDLAKGDAQKEARLTAAACALVHCADGVPKDDSSYVLLKALQDAGSSMTGEKDLLSKQIGTEGRSTGSLFRYTGVDEYLIDPITQNKIGTRTIGAVQGVAGTVGVVGSGALCTTGIGCAAGAITGTVSADYAIAGAMQAATGKANVPSGEQVLQSLGMSPGAAALTYSALGILPVGVEVALVNKAAAAQTAANTAAKLSYESAAGFGAKGIQATPDLMQTKQVQSMINEYVMTGTNPKDAVEFTKILLSTSTSIPQELIMRPGTELIKLVPKTALGGDTVGGYSPFFVTRSQYDALLKMPANKIADALGLPAEQGIRGSQLGFDVYSMTPKPGAAPKVFASQIAPVEQGSYSANGGAQQILVPNRSLWTDPNGSKIGQIAGGK
jgi:hypothetical protein